MEHTCLLLSKKTTNRYLSGKTTVSYLVEVLQPFLELSNCRVHAANFDLWVLPLGMQTISDNYTDIAGGRNIKSARLLLLLTYFKLQSMSYLWMDQLKGCTLLKRGKLHKLGQITPLTLDCSALQNWLVFCMHFQQYALWIQYRNKAKSGIKTTATNTLLYKLPSLYVTIVLFIFIFACLCNVVWIILGFIYWYKLLICDLKES